MPEITPDKIVRSRRKTIGLQITPKAELIVKIPWYLPPSQIAKIIKEKEAWIIKKQQEIKSRLELVQQKTQRGQPTYLYLGKSYPLTLQPVTTSPVAFTGEHFVLNQFNQKNAPLYLTNWYKRQALAYFKNRVAFFASKAGVSYSSITLTDATTKWGSCSHDNHLKFNWLLIMAPGEVIDYVVAHEIAHISQKNHSFRFWNTVSKLYPEFRTSRRWLTTHGHTLQLTFHSASTL